MSAWRPRGLAFCCCALLVAATAGAHHSFAPYDRTKEVSLTGTVKDFQWTNPHTWIQVMVQDKSGRAIEWSIECGSPNMMARTGWKKTTLAPGSKVVLTMNPLRNGRAGGSLVRVTLADGTVLGPGDAPPPRPLGSTLSGAR